MEEGGSIWGDGECGSYVATLSHALLRYRVQRHAFRAVDDIVFPVFWTLYRIRRAEWLYGEYMPERLCRIVLWESMMMMGNGRAPNLMDKGSAKGEATLWQRRQEQYGDETKCGQTDSTLSTFSSREPVSFGPDVSGLAGNSANYRISIPWSGIWIMHHQPSCILFYMHQTCLPGLAILKGGRNCSNGGNKHELNNCRTI